MNTETYILKSSPNSKKKFRIITPSFVSIDFGAAKPYYEDYTIHKDKERKRRYIQRHQKRENWTKSGINTPGFWSKNLLWNKKTIEESIKDIEKKFGIRIISI